MMPVMDVTRVSHRKHLILESLYIGMPWTELDYMLAVNTSAPIYVQLKEKMRPSIPST
jgi:vanillate/4-hydroxybenzoate decarboxylase subunit C